MKELFDELKWRGYKFKYTVTPKPPPLDIWEKEIRDEMSRRTQMDKEDKFFAALILIGAICEFLALTSIIGVGLYLAHHFLVKYW